MYKMVDWQLDARAASGGDAARCCIMTELDPLETWEEAEWLLGSSEEVNDEISNDWIRESDTNMDLQEQAMCCEREVIDEYMNLREEIKKINERVEAKAKKRSNPYETIGRSIFMDRNAVKMANIDRRTDYMFTRPTKPDGSEMVTQEELMYFADIGGECGGFSEYIHWRYGWRAKGLGFSRRHEFGYKTDRFCKNGATFDANQGSLTKNDRVESYTAEERTQFRSFVNARTLGHGVCFVIAHGSFSLRFTLKELIYRRSCVSRLAMAISVVKPAGHIMITLFETFTVFTISLIYLMYKCFDRIAIFKPYSCRPASAERVLLCKWRCRNVDHVVNYLHHIADRLDNRTGCSRDVMCVVPEETMRQDADFIDYMSDINRTITATQMSAMRQLLHFARDASLTETRQDSVRRECLQLWALPDVGEAGDNHRNDSQSPEIAAYRMGLSAPAISFKTIPLKSMFDVQSHIDRKCEWRVAISTAVYDEFDTPQSDAICWIISLKSDQVYQYNGACKLWLPLGSLKLPADTLLLAELTIEIDQQKDGRYGCKYSLHILDAMWLAGDNVGIYDAEKRHQLCQLFAAAVNTSRRDLITVRSRPTYPISRLNELVYSLAKRTAPGSQLRKIIAAGISSRTDANPPLQDSTFFETTGIVFFRRQELLGSDGSNTANNQQMFDRFLWTWESANHLHIPEPWNQNASCVRPKQHYPLSANLGSITLQALIDHSKSFR